MRTRRGSELWPGEMGGMVSIFKPGDIVQSVILQGGELLMGVVREVDTRLNKIWVAWNGGSVVQHDPDEIQFVPHVDQAVRDSLNRTVMASRRGKLSADVGVPHGEQYRGDPETHGLDKPRGGGFSIMQDLQKDLAKESKAEAEEGPRVASMYEMKSRRAMYWSEPGRVYRMTRNELQNGGAVCPRCGKPMTEEPFTKSEKLYTCQKCGFKIPTGKVKKVEVEIEDGEVEVKVSSRRSR